MVRLPIKLVGPLKWTVKREAKYSVHGPVLEVADKSYALRFSGMSDIKQVNQWYAMNKSNSLEDRGHENEIYNIFQWCLC